MAGRPTFDTLELKILHALQVDGRAPFGRIADVLGVSDQTVARRYARLRASRNVRVTARTDTALTGESSWFVRVRCAPNVARTVAEALARRPETSWVRMTSGGTEIVAVVREPSGDDRHTLLLEKLPHTPQVTDIRANHLLHVFFGGPEGAVDVLSPAQVARLRPSPSGTIPTPVVLDDGDRRMLAVLERDGRTDFTALAAATGRPATTLRRRLAELRAGGAVYFDVDYDYRDLAMGSQAILWLSVAPDQLLAAGRALARHPEISFAAATTGATNLYASVLCPDPGALFRYLTDKVAALPAVHHVETAPVVSSLKNLGARAP